MLSLLLFYIAMDMAHVKSDCKRLEDENVEMKSNLRDAMKAAAEQIAKFEIQNQDLKDSLKDAREETAGIIEEAKKRKIASSDLTFDIERLKEDRKQLTKQAEILNAKLLDEKTLSTRQHKDILELNVTLRDKHFESDKHKREVESLRKQVSYCSQ